MTTERYNAGEAEPHWQTIWGEHASFTARNDDPRPKYYVLEMFPYPSGRIHMGHVRNYAMGDVVARYRRAKGFNVIHPMGWDAFGLPAENAAFQNKVASGDLDLRQNIDAMRDPAEVASGLTIDWSPRGRDLRAENITNTNSAMFLDFLDANGLAYRAGKSKVNWDPVENTVLANEQVIDGLRLALRRAGRAARKLSQWFLKITEYADELLAALEDFGQAGPTKSALMQEQLDRQIGRAVGPPRPSCPRLRRPATTRAARSIRPGPTRCSARSFLADFPPDHPLAAADGRSAIRRWPSSSPNAARLGTSRGGLIETAEKKRLRYRVESGPSRSTLNGSLPVYVANFVLMEYGTGAIFGCPAHDQRDLDFARLNTACRSPPW